MTIKILSTKQAQDINCALTKKLKWHRMRLNKWVKENPEHPDRIMIIHQKMKRIDELEALKNNFPVHPSTLAQL